jgi:hypothetical protein
MLTGRACRIRGLVLCGFFTVLLANCSGQKFEAVRGKTKPTPDSGVGIPRDDTDASAEGGAPGSGGTRATGGHGEGGASNGGSDDGGTMSSGGVAGSPSPVGGAGGGSGGRAAGGSLQSGGAPSTGGSHQSGGAPGSGGGGGSGGRGSGGVVQTGGASQSGGAGGGLSCSGDKCSACCDVLYPTMGGPTMTGSRIFSGEFYGCACAVGCYTVCAASLCDSQDPHPSIMCLSCLYSELINGACSASWAKCQQNKVCSNFGKCAFGCL